MSRPTHDLLLTEADERRALTTHRLRLTTLITAGCVLGLVFHHLGLA